MPTSTSAFIFYSSPILLSTNVPSCNIGIVSNVIRVYRLNTYSIKPREINPLFFLFSARHLLSLQSKPHLEPLFLMLMQKRLLLCQRSNLFALQILTSGSSSFTTSRHIPSRGNLEKYWQPRWTRETIKTVGCSLFHRGKTEAFRSASASFLSSRSLYTWGHSTISLTNGTVTKAYLKLM